MTTTDSEAPAKPPKPLTSAQKAKEEKKKREEAVFLARALERIKVLQDAKRLESSFFEFVKSSWSQFDPAEFEENWHLRDLCDHMEAASLGYIRRGVWNVPPRTAKSNIVSICFPAWIWAQTEKTALRGPQVQFFYASYSHELALEHSLKCRRLIESPWYSSTLG